MTHTKQNSVDIEYSWEVIKSNTACPNYFSSALCYFLIIMVIALLCLLFPG